MKIPNRKGTPIDPVPFLVVALLAGTIAFAWGPVYLLGLDVDLDIAVGISAALAAVATIIAFYRLIWTANPTIREEVPAGVRFRKFVYGIIVGVIVVLALFSIQVW